MLLVAVMTSGCVEEDGKDSKVIPVISIYDNGNWTLANKIDVTKNPVVFDLCILSDGRFRDVTVESNDPQCSVEVVSPSKPKYSDDGRLIGYTYVLRIDMRQEKIIKLIITHHETKYLKDIPCSVTLIRK